MLILCGSLSILCRFYVGSVSIFMCLCFFSTQHEAGDSVRSLRARERVIVFYCRRYHCPMSRYIIISHMGNSHRHSVVVFDNVAEVFDNDSNRW